MTGSASTADPERRWRHQHDHRFDQDRLERQPGDPAERRNPGQYASNNTDVMTVAPTSDSLDASGDSSSTATAVDPGDATISCTIDGQTLSYPFTVAGPSTATSRPAAATPATTTA